MFQERSGFIVSVAIFSGISVILCVIALGTDYWIVSDAYITAGSPSKINYGLFTGSLSRKINFVAKHYSLTMTCVNTNNGIGKCGLSCLYTQEAREKEVRDLIQGLNRTFVCDNIGIANWDSPIGTTGYYRGYLPKEKRIFIDYGMYITTLVFLSLSIFMAFMCAIISVMNFAAKHFPLKPFFGITSLYFCNGIAVTILLVTLAIWGAEFNNHISQNIAILDTLTGQADSNKFARLGFSFWVLLIAMLIHIFNMVLLLCRKALLDEQESMKRRPGVIYNSQQHLELIRKSSVPKNIVKKSRYSKGSTSRILLT